MSRDYGENESKMPVVWGAEQEREVDIFFKDVQKIDRIQAEALVMEEAYLKSQEIYGGTITKLRLEIQSIDSNVSGIEARVAILEQKKSRTPKRTKRLRSKVKGWSDTEKPKWSGWDITALFLSSVALLSTLGIGFANVYANLMASGEPVFLNNELLAVFIALLMPVASIALKSLSICFESESAKKHFRSSVFVLTTLSLIGWSVAFADQFSGVTTGIDFTRLGESSSGKGAPILVWLQLMSEMLVAVSLGLIIEGLLDKHSDYEWAENAEYYQLCADLTPLNSKLSKLRDQHNVLTVKLYEAERCVEQIHHGYRLRYTLWLSQSARDSDFEQI